MAFVDSNKYPDPPSNPLEIPEYLRRLKVSLVDLFNDVDLALKRLLATTGDIETYGARERLEFIASGSLSSGDVAQWHRVFTSGNIKDIHAMVKTESSSGHITIDIEKSSNITDAIPTWTSIFSTVITIEENELSSSSASTSYSLDSDSFSSDDVFRIFVDDAGTGAEDLIVEMEVEWTT